MLIILITIFAYVFGSVSSAIIVCRLMQLPDPRISGSHNPGATNVLRIGGKKAAAITLLGDVLKGTIPVLIAKLVSEDALVLATAAAAAFLGHLLPLFSGFKGGKGVATAAGVFIGLSWTLTLILLAVWVLIASVFRYSSLAALTTAVIAIPLTLIFLPHPAYQIMAVFITALLLWRHKANIARLIQGTESKIMLKKKS